MSRRLATIQPDAQSLGVPLKVSEIFESLQGEGPSVGTPCVFLRLATCNLRCTWCDTAYTWDWEKYRYEDEVRSMDVGSVATRLLEASARRLVVTGGEPLLQQASLLQLLERIDGEAEGFFVEVETNGTLAPERELAARVDQWNVSPKLANSGEPERRRLNLDALRALLATGRSWLKLVVATEADADEALALAEAVAWPRDRVLLMPEAASREALAERAPDVARASQARGVRFSSRLHLELWGGERGR